MSTEDREGRDIQTELRDRIGQAIERSQAHVATSAREPDRDHNRASAEPDGDQHTQDRPSAIEPLQRDPYDPPPTNPLEPGPEREPERQREPVERPSYIQEAIDRERDRQQAFEQGIEQEQENDRGFGID